MFLVPYAVALFFLLWTANPRHIPTLVPPRIPSHCHVRGAAPALTPVQALGPPRPYSKPPYPTR